MSNVHIEAWSDIACPWCWVGKRHLESALSEFEGEVEFVWRAFELNPNAPIATTGKIDYAERLAKKYRTSREDAQSMIDRMVSAGRDSGLDLRFDRIRPTNTFDAHRLLSWSAEFGLQDQLKERLFAAYLNEGLVISDHAVLTKVAVEVGLDAELTMEILSTNKHGEDVREEERQAKQMGVSGVPYFMIGRSAFAGAQPAKILLAALEKAKAETGRGSGNIDTGA